MTISKRGQEVHNWFHYLPSLRLSLYISHFEWPILSDLVICCLLNVYPSYGALMDIALSTLPIADDKKCPF